MKRLSILILLLFLSLCACGSGSGSKEDEGGATGAADPLTTMNNPRELEQRKTVSGVIESVGNVDWYHLGLMEDRIVYRKPTAIWVPVIDIEECKPVTLADVQRSNAGWTYND